MSTAVCHESPRGHQAQHLSTTHNTPTVHACTGLLLDCLLGECEWGQHLGLIGHDKGEAGREVGLDRRAAGQPWWHPGAAGGGRRTFCTVQYSTVLYLYMQYLHCTVLYVSDEYCAVLYCTVLYCTVLWLALLGDCVGGAHL